MFPCGQNEISVILLHDNILLKIYWLPGQELLLCHCYIALVPCRGNLDGRYTTKRILLQNVPLSNPI
jgi:hypothetical protein